MSIPIGFRVGSETIVACKNDINNFEMQKVNMQLEFG